MKDKHEAHEPLFVGEFRRLLEEGLPGQQLRSKLSLLILGDANQELESERELTPAQYLMLMRTFPRFRGLLFRDEWALSVLSSTDMWLPARFKSPEKHISSTPPFNAEYVLYLLLRKEEREVVIGDLVEEYGSVLERFNKRRADIWFYKQVAGSLLPLLRRALLRIGALVWLGRILRRLVS